MMLMQPTQPEDQALRRPDAVRPTMGGTDTLSDLERQAVEDGGMRQHDLEDLLSDCQWEPNWRDEADQCAAYYDGHQTTSEQQRLLKEGQPILVVNLISRTINAMLGNEVKQRTNWKLTADVEELWGDVTDAMQVKLTEAQRETRANIAISEAYAGQTKAALHWVEVSRDADPFAAYPYRVKPVHRREIWWDWRAKEPDLSDARWLIRKQWHDWDDLAEMMPELRDLLSAYTGMDWSTMSFGELQSNMATYERREGERQSFRVSPDEWLDTRRQRIMTYEVWYTRRVQTVAMVLSDGTVREFDQRRPEHVAAMQRGMVKLIRAPKKVYRQAMFVGPHRIQDRATRMKRFPYVPFMAFRDDETSMPYSMVAGMIGPQDEYNARRSRLMWLLQAAQVFVDDDALVPHQGNLLDLASEIMRPDAFVVLNSKRQRDQAIRIERNTQLPGDQQAVMQDARQLIMEQSGVSATMMGDAVPGVKSGVAFGSLVQQSANAIGDHDDNYRLGRTIVGELLLDLIIEDHQRPDMQVRVGTTRPARVVVLNTFDQQGMPVNHVAGADITVAVDDAPSSPAYKSMQQQQIGQILSSAGNDPAARAVLLPAFLEASDLPNRENDARWLRKQYGVPQPGDRQAEAQAEAQQAQMAQAQAQLQARAAQVEMAKAEAEAITERTAASLNVAKAAEIRAGIQAEGIRIGMDQQRVADERAMQQAQANQQAQAAGPARAIDEALAAALAAINPQRAAQQPQGMPPPR